MRVLWIGGMLWGCQSSLHWHTSLVSFTQSLLEPGSAGPPGEAQHSDPGLQQLHVSCQVPLHAKRHHSVHQQEQDQQPACVCGGDLEKVPQHQVSFFSLMKRLCWLLLLPHVFLILLTAGSLAWWTTRQHPATSMEAVWPSTQTTGERAGCFHSESFLLNLHTVCKRHIISMSYIQTCAPHSIMTCVLLLPPLPHDVYRNTTCKI